jgi:predicted ATPase/DNA-binding SARP family transcriptional activator
MAHLSINLLGPILVSLDSQVITSFEYDKVRALLVYLASEADRPHRRQELAGLLWPDLPESIAFTNLRQALAKLRQAIHDHDAKPPFLLISRETVQFNRDSDYWSDVDTVNALLLACDHHRHRHPRSCRVCVRRRQEAMALYRGDFLAHFSVRDSNIFEEWSIIKREGLRRSALDSLYWLAEYHLRREEYDLAYACASKQLELDTWREESHRQAIVALAMNGHRSAALVQYERCRSILAEELQVKPGRELVDLHQRIKANEPAMVLEREPGRVGRQLMNEPGPFSPLPLSPWIGRESELAEINETLENPTCRLLSLVGPGGIGKTRLALQVAIEQLGAFEHGVYFLSLASLETAGMALVAIAEAFTLKLDLHGELKAQLISHLGQKDILLVLDSIEHLLAENGNQPGIVSLVNEILQKTSTLSLLVTSRKRLNLQAEWVFDLDGLPYPLDGTDENIIEYPAVQLFIQRAKQVRRSFRLDRQEVEAIRRICQLVEGMPLAIEMAASASRHQPCTLIAAGLESGVRHLATSASDVPDRHRSMWAVFEHSCRLLSNEEAHAFNRLCVFQGGFYEGAALQVANIPVEVLHNLVDQSLVRCSTYGQDSHYDIHELLRQFGQDRLAMVGEVQEVRDRHLDYFSSLVEQAEPHLYAAGQQTWLDRLTRDHENLRAALNWAFIGNSWQTAARLGGALSRFWGLRGYLKEGRQWLDKVQVLLDQNLPESLPRIEAHGVDSGDDPASTLSPHHQAAFALQAKVFLGSGMLAWRMGDLGEAASLMEKSLSFSRLLGDTNEISRNLHSLATVLSTQGEYARAATLLEECLAMDRQRRNLQGIAYDLGSLGDIAYDQGNYAQAAAFYKESLELHRERQDKLSIAICLNNLGEVMRHLGKPRQAIQLIEEGVALFHELDIRQSLAFSLVSLGELKQANGEHGRALELFRQALKLQHELGAKGDIVSTLLSLAAFAQKESEQQRAVRLYAAAESLRETVQVTLSTAQLDELEGNIHAAKVSLGESGFDIAYQQGRTMDLDQSIAYALEGTSEENDDHP